MRQYHRPPPYRMLWERLCYAPDVEKRMGNLSLLNPLSQHKRSASPERSGRVPCGGMEDSGVC